ncbi:MAG: discoidin domain-containing protein [Muribaculaceae bacterium]|nr:discoidin domain-containing protein [Muribaculaceae bacterium]
MKKLHIGIALTGALLWPLAAIAQQPVIVGGASYAEYPPAYKAQTAEHSGFNATKMLTRKLYVDESEGRPLPTNDWWTDLMVSEFSGALWSYPAMLRTAAEGVTVCFPTRWSDNGTEVLSDSWLRVGGVKFTASEARATDWHDWDVEALLPSASGFGSIKATLAHGTPFSWFEFAGVSPEIAASAAPQLVRTDRGSALVRVGNDSYGLYFADDVEPAVANGSLLLDGAEWLSVAPLKSERLYEQLKPYAASIVRNTMVDWSYDEKSSRLQTTWTVSAENLRDRGAAAPVVQGFLPHAYRHCVESTVDYIDDGDYLTPRGTLRLAAAADGKFSYSYRFSGMLPYYAAPQAHEGYSPELMRQLIEEYASGGGFGDDTYWGGKGLTQMALNMTFASQTGHTELYELSKSKLRAALVDWLTYSPGESTKFFAYYPRWGGMLGFDVSYDSDAFNDHHFHYGYFIYAAALLCMEDAQFARDYGEILRMIVKDYANYDRTDKRFPFLRTLDPWAGHSYAGGLGDHGNDNGNGQESSSEAMQGWGGVYLLGVALGDRAMRDAGIFGWLTESRGVVEYWFDRSRSNYDYTRYEHPYNTNLTSKGIGWWTWFSGDPLWMHSIQWMPVSPCLNYMSEDLDFVKWDYETMMQTTAYSWFDGQEPLARQSVGNVVLCYMERSDPEGAARIFDQARSRGMEMARNVDTGHISYFVIHSHLTYGEIDFGVTADCPSANAYRRADGKETYMVYNPDEATREVTFYRNGAAVRTVNAPGRRLTVFSDEARPSQLEIASTEGFIVPPGASTLLSGKCFDQYGAEVQAQAVTFKVEPAALASITGGRLTVSASAPRGSRFTVTATSGGLTASAEFTVNDRPEVRTARIAGIPELLEVNSPVALQMICVDQYGTETAPDADWTVNGLKGSVPAAFDSPGVYNIVATCGDAKAEARVVVLPVLPDVARGCKVQASSQENVGTAPENAVDGDRSTRWGSAHTESEWFMADLGTQHKITSVAIDWETAYATDYDVEVSADGKTWTTAHEQRGLGSAGKVRHSISAEGRYVRINCLRRATQYGYSIIELEVGAISASAGQQAVIGLDITAPQLMAEGVGAEIGVRGFTLQGNAVEVSGVEWSSDPAGLFADGMFIPQTYGRHTLTARSGSLRASATVLVEESVKLTSLSVTPENSLILTGDEAVLTLEGVNQFGGVYPIEPESVSVAIEPAGASFNPATGIFKAERRGDYVLTFNGGMAVATVSVRDVAEANLAAGKQARASSYVGGNSADKAFDLNPDTRWESAGADGEWLAVDLGSAFVLNRVVINWEAAYASSFAVETSMDGLNWYQAAEVTAGRGGREEVLLPEMPASELRIVCRKRATAYGNSIYELEVYGSARFDGSGTGQAPQIESIDLECGNGAVSGSVNLQQPAFVTVGISNAAGGGHLAETKGFGAKVDFAFADLLSGDYVIEAVAEDAFGNSTAESRTVAVEYSLDGVNVALNKPATATSAENGALTADKAVDGDTSTRWGSEFNDGEAITVDLVNTYELDRIRIVWNKPAYATDYIVETSTDGVHFVTAIDRRDWNGDIDDAPVAPVAARYVRVTGLHRATPYGTSIDELEVYAQAILPTDDAIVAVQAGSDAGRRRYDLLGRPVSPAYRGLTITRGWKGVGGAGLAH